MKAECLIERNFRLTQRNPQAMAVLHPQNSTRHSVLTASGYVDDGILRFEAIAWRPVAIVSRKTEIHCSCCSKTIGGRSSIRNCSSTSWTREGRRRFSWSLFLALAFAASCQFVWEDRSKMKGMRCVVYLVLSVTRCTTAFDFEVKKLCNRRMQKL